MIHAAVRVIVALKSQFFYQWRKKKQTKEGIV